jgi:phage gpG-like protein
MTKTTVDTVQAKFSELSMFMQTQLVPIAALELFELEKQHIEQQIDVSGKAYQARKDKTDRRKMLLGLKNRLELRIDDLQATIGFSDSRTADIARIHNEGLTVTESVRPQTRSKLDQPATPRQAKILLDLGFRIGRKKPTMTQIMANYTIGKANFLIHLISEQQGIEVKQSWLVKMPKRELMGFNNRDIQRVKDKVSNQLNSVI